MKPHYVFDTFLGTHIHMGVCGSVSAFRALDLLRWFNHNDLTTSATLTRAACEFVTPLSFKALGATEVYTGMFEGEPDSYAHLHPAPRVGAMLIAPASANMLAKLAHGMADDMLSCQALANTAPLIIAPAMNPNMWNNPATRANWARLGEFGHILVEPESGTVACGDRGKGRLADLQTIFMACLKAVSPQDLTGIKALITLGPTREYWDAVRYWSNPSSGRMGACIAAAAWLRGAEVTVVQGPCEQWLPDGVNVLPVGSASDMYDACMDHWHESDMACLTAAVCDFRPEPFGSSKFKKSGVHGQDLNISFSSNKDILATLGRDKRSDQKLIGFAAETDDVQTNAADKLERKNLDMIIANDVSREGSGFGVSTNAVTLLDRQGRVEEWPTLPKTEVAWRIWDCFLQLSA